MHTTLLRGEYCYLQFKLLQQEDKADTAKKRNRFNQLLNLFDGYMEVHYTIPFTFTFALIKRGGEIRPLIKK